MKLRVADAEGLLAKLRALGAVPHGRVLERNTLFDTDSGDFRLRRRLLRLRVETPAASSFASAGAARTVLTAKAPPVPHGRRRKPRYKVNLEREVAVHDPSPRPPQEKRTLRDRGWSFALGCLGLRTGFRYEKYRTMFTWGGVLIDLDETPIGTFLELEGDPAAIDHLARELGYGPGDYLRETYYDLYVADRRHKALPVRHMLFRK